MNESTQTPSERLARSREQMRLSLQPPSANAAGSKNQTLASQPSWFDMLKANPGARVVIDVVGQWWNKHPLRTVVSVAAVAATASLKPVARRYPWSLVAGAAALGGVVVWCRPWRWSRPALLAGLMPQLLLAAVKAARPRADTTPPTHLH